MMRSCVCISSADGVRTAIDEIEARIKSASDRGELAWFNAAYREWRYRAKACGRGMSYRGALARLRNGGIKQLILLGVNDLRADLLPRVFPQLPTGAVKIYVDGLEKPAS
jgi:hypothetical protein